MVQNRRSRTSLRRRAKGLHAPKTRSGRGETVASALAPFVHPPYAGTHICWGVKHLIALAGEIRTSDLTEKTIRIINGKIEASASGFTKKSRAGALRRTLQYLHKHHGGADIASAVIRPTNPRPRNVIATEEERAKILAAAPAYLRCWLLLCSDVAIRSGTAAALGPDNYDRARRQLVFSTKYQNRQRLPVTEELAAILDTCKDPSLTFVAQLARGCDRNGIQYGPLGRMHVNSLRKAYVKLRLSCGITRKLTPHDLRRTTATRIYENTRDLRLVQALLGHGNLTSTLWYLDHHRTPVDLESLELAKLNPKTERIQ